MRYECPSDCNDANPTHCDTTARFVQCTVPTLLPKTGLAISITETAATGVALGAQLAVSFTFAALGEYAFLHSDDDFERIMTGICTYFPCNILMDSNAKC